MLGAPVAGRRLAPRRGGSNLRAQSYTVLRAGRGWRRGTREMGQRPLMTCYGGEGEVEGQGAGGVDGRGSSDLGSSLSAADDRIGGSPVSRFIDGVKAAVPEGPLRGKMASLGALFFFSTFNYTILTNTKDALIITAPGSGVECIPFLQAWAVLPATLLAMLGYGKLCDTLPMNKVYYAMVAPFLLFYVTFALWIYPAHSLLHPVAWATQAVATLPAGLHGLIQIIHNWTFCLFWVFAEIWGSTIIALLFWTTANDICSMEEAKLIYPLVGIMANVALVMAGNLLQVVNINTSAERLGMASADAMQVSLNVLIGIVTLGGALMFLTKAYIDRAYKSLSSVPGAIQGGGAKREKRPKMDFKDGLKVLVESPRIRSISAMVMGYGISHKVFEVAWKGQLRLLYTTGQEYGAVLGEIATLTGWLTIVMMLAGRFVFQYLGWGFAAAVTPVATLLTGAGFFVLSFLVPSSVAGGQIPTMLVAAAMLGNVCQIAGRVFKYSLFDPAKEMVYIQMSKEEKTKGKAAVDVVGNQIGKSSGSWITQLLLIYFGSFSAAMPYLGAIYVAVISLWLGAARGLSNTVAADNKAEAV